MSGWSIELIVDPTVCDGHGVCSEILPERIDRDPWGFPIIEEGDIEPAHLDHAVRAVRACPRQALHLVERTC